LASKEYIWGETGISQALHESFSHCPINALGQCPNEGVDATVLEVDHLCKRVKVLIYPEMGRMEVWLPFDNVIYSVYLNHDPDKLYANSGEYDPNQITNEAIDSIMNFRRI
jgi:hypothetical protein